MGTEGDILTSINLKFPSSKHEFTLVIPSSVRFIRTEAFMNVHNVNMELTFGEGISIENSAFQGCTGLKSVDFKGNVAKIGEKAFKDCYGLVLLSTKHVERIENYAFDRCKNLNGNLVISTRTKYISDFAFSTCTNISGDLIIPYTLKELGSCAFAACYSLDGIVNIASNLKVIKNSCFTDCINLKGVILPNSIEQIESSAFRRCLNIKGEMVIPYNCKSIGDWAFAECYGMTSLVLLDKLETIGSHAFLQLHKFQRQLEDTGFSDNDRRKFFSTMWF